MLHGVIIVARGPINVPEIDSLFTQGESNSQTIFSIATSSSFVSIWSAVIGFFGLPKNRIISLKLYGKNNLFCTVIHPQSLTFLTYLFTDY